VLLAHAAVDAQGSSILHLQLSMLLPLAAPTGVDTMCCWRMPLL
jgi:hypothetical protein